jgi:hypothetical protein
MKRSSTIFLQVVIVLIGIGVLAALLWEPHLEGRNAHATLFEIYFKDPFLAYVYVASIPFFVALYQAVKVLGYAGQNKVFSQAAVNALRTIKYCALITAGAIVAADAFLMIHARLYPELGAQDGPEGAVVLGVVATFASIVIATAAAMFERILQNAVDIKSENDLTV